MRRDESFIAGSIGIGDGEGAEESTEGTEIVGRSASPRVGCGCVYVGITGSGNEVNLVYAADIVKEGDGAGGVSFIDDEGKKKCENKVR